MLDEVEELRESLKGELVEIGEKSKMVFADVEAKCHR
jgi:hypothetical protein